MVSDSPAPNLERSLYYGLLFMCVCYGFEIYMFSHSLILWLRTGGPARRARRFYIIIGALSMIFTGIVIANDAVFMQFMWIDKRNHPGGPLGYLADNSSIWFQTWGTAANMVTNFIGDALLIYRLYVIWQANVWITVFPILLYLGSMSMALVTLYQSAVPGSHFFRGNTVRFGVPWAALSVALNIVVTALITYQLMRCRKQLKRILPEDALRMYTGVSAILIESALPFSILGILFAITYGKNMDVGPAFLFVWATFCALSPQFIIFRVTVGKSWTSDLISQAHNGTTFNSVAFRPRDGMGSMTVAEEADKTPGKPFDDAGSDHELEFVKGNDPKPPV